MKLAALLSLLTIGCIPTMAQPSYFNSANPNPYPNQEGASVAAAPGAAHASTCIEIVQCLASCSESTCFQGCYANGDQASQAAVGALLQCNQAGGSCEPELAQCRAQSGVVAQAPQRQQAPQPQQPQLQQINGKRQPVANSAILPWLTGYWTSSRNHFEFFGDGRVRRANGGMMEKRRPGTTNKYDDCVATSNDVGTVTQQGDLLIMTFGGTDSYTCGIREKTAGTTVRYRIEWVDNPYYELDELQLQLRDIDCTNGDMWCVDRIQRRK